MCKYVRMRVPDEILLKYLYIIYIKNDKNVLPLSMYVFFSLFDTSFNTFINYNP